MAVTRDEAQVIPVNRKARMDNSLKGTFKKYCRFSEKANQLLIVPTKKYEFMMKRKSNYNQFAKKFSKTKNIGARRQSSLEAVSSEPLSNYSRRGKKKKIVLGPVSDLVKWAKGTREAIQILQAKEDVWARTSPYWNELTEDDVIHKYDVVIILEDYNEEKGIVVSPLVEVVGFTQGIQAQCDVQKAIKMQISWLNSKGTAAFVSLNWVSSDIIKTDGYFRVKWTKGARGAMHNFPAKKKGVRARTGP
ncbi:protein of unknown function-containing protein [Forsythia ovata]|uniref:DUF3444 domain-containing protein n=1 Tax=Forsythia ovata TaxID=205694 RepID=A0ABD1P242_9LAMI